MGSVAASLGRSRGTWRASPFCSLYQSPEQGIIIPILLWKEVPDFWLPGCCMNAHKCMCTHTAQIQDSGPEGLERGGHPGLLSLESGKPVERRASVLANKEVGSFLLGFQWAPLLKACFPIQILPTDLPFTAACFLNAPLGSLARSCSCRAYGGRAAIWAGLGNETHCSQHRSNHPTLRFYLGGN